MNENINLCEILKGHEGETFYSPIAGNIILEHINDNSNFENPLLFIDADNEFVTFTANGYYVSIFKNAEPVLFPSKNQRDWNKWLEEQNNKIPKTWRDYINSNLYSPNSIINEINKYHLIDNSIEKSALALIKIHQLIEVGYGGNVTNKEWKTNKLPKYCIVVTICGRNDKESYISLEETTTYKRSIAFHNRKQAIDFLSYPENVQLLKEYFMI